MITGFYRVILMVFLFSSCGEILKLGGEAIPPMGKLLTKDELSTTETMVINSLEIERGLYKINNSVYFGEGYFLNFPRREEYISPSKILTIGDTITLQPNPAQVIIKCKNGKEYIYTKMNKSDSSWFDEWW